MLLLLPGDGISQLFVAVANLCDGDGSGTKGERNDGGQDKQAGVETDIDSALPI